MALPFAFFDLNIIRKIGVEEMMIRTNECLFADVSALTRLPR